MKVLLQRVSRAAVRVEGRTVGEIGPGLVVFVGVEKGDRPADADYLADKAAELRIFPDAERRMNRSVEESGGAALVVSHTEEEPPPVVATAPYGYLRLRREAYESDDLAQWARIASDQGWEDVYVFFKHEDTGAGPALAERFVAELARAAPG